MNKIFLIFFSLLFFWSISPVNGQGGPNSPSSATSVNIGGIGWITAAGATSNGGAVATTTSRLRTIFDQSDYQ
ncbi:MAG: hypothetical protein KKH44_12740, partial [Bacteroidetes bacterium]|nr:hypothetical protein [Bacteroidota bacterium]